MGFSYEKQFQKHLSTLHQEKRYRTFVPLQKMPHTFPQARSKGQPETKPVTLWSTNDYLGMGHDARAIKALQNEASQSGVSSGGTRNISGTHPLHNVIESRLAHLHGKEAALLFNSGYAANHFSLCCLGKLLPGCIFFSDAENHASIIQGIRSSASHKVIFNHNSPADLEAKLKASDPNAPKVIVCESVYSMSGDFAPLQDFASLAKRYNALLYVDEVHGVGLYGESGSGLCSQAGILESATLIQGTLAKAFGSLGGYIAGDATLVDLIRSHASGFIFSTALPPPVLAASLKNIESVTQDDTLRQQFWNNVQATKQALRIKGIAFQETPSHIIPLVVGNSETCGKLAQALWTRHNLYVQAINYPTVPKGTERLRITPLRGHTPEMIEGLANALAEELDILGINVPAGGLAAKAVRQNYADGK